MSNFAFIKYVKLGENIGKMFMFKARYNFLHVVAVVNLF